MSSPRAAQAPPSSPRRPPTERSSKSPASATSPPAPIDTATQDQGQDAPIEADVSFAKSTADILALILCA